MPRASGCMTKPLPNDKARLRALFERLAEHAPVLMAVDQPTSIDALPVAVARACGCQVAFLPGLTTRRLADLHPGAAKTDARDAYVIADGFQGSLGPGDGEDHRAWGSRGLGPLGKYCGPRRSWPKASERARPPRGPAGSLFQTK
jgi:hypothetical protein